MDKYQARFVKGEDGKKQWYVEERGIAVWQGLKEEVLKEAERLNRITRGR